MGTWSVAAGLVLGCSDDSSLENCGLLRASSSDDLGCSSAILDLSPHPCTLAVNKSCGNDSDCADPAMKDCATDYYLRSYSAGSMPTCDPDRPLVTIDAELDLSLFRGIRISDASTAVHTNALQHYFDPQKLWMHTDDVAETNPMRFAMAGTVGEFDRALIDAGVSPSADMDSLTVDEQTVALEAISTVMFAPTREVLTAHAKPMEPKVNVVVIDRILPPSLVDLLALGGTVVGLGLSPALLERVDETSEHPVAMSLNTMLDLDDDFTPTLFVGHADIARLTQDFDLVIAHEMGHALGLPHVEDEGNLMEQGGEDNCRRWLSQEQIDLMGPFAQAVLAADGALLRILAGRENVLRRVLDARKAQRD
jgi:hypothetical protein